MAVAGATGMLAAAPAARDPHECHGRIRRRFACGVVLGAVISLHGLAACDREAQVLDRVVPPDRVELGFDRITGIVFQELYRIGALDTEAYASESFVSRKNLQPLDPKVQAQIKQLSDQAFGLEEAQLAQNPNSADALYARGVTRGLRATYMAMGQHAWISALRTAVAARHDHERVLELDPNFVDAKNLVGIHLYVVGSLSFPVKMAAAMTGITGSKQKGLDYLREVAARGTPDVSSDAKIALAMFLRREQKYTEAIQVVGQLQQEHPKNFLVAAEYAHLLNAAGHGQAAITAYRKVVDGCKASIYPVCQLTVPAFGLGEALRGQREYQQAAEAYDLAASYISRSGVPPEGDACGGTNVRRASEA